MIKNCNNDTNGIIIEFRYQIDLKNLLEFLLIETIKYNIVKKIEIKSQKIASYCEIKNSNFQKKILSKNDV